MSHRFVAGLLLGLAGCAHTDGVTGTPTPEVPKPVTPVEKAEAKEPAPKQLKPNTLVAMAAFKEQMANELAKSPDDCAHLLEEARKAYASALAEEPKCIGAHIGLARNWEKSGQHDKALTCYDNALQLAPAEARLWHEVGMCEAKHKNFEKALARLRKAVDLEPENKPFLSSYALCLARAGQFDEALVWLNKVYRTPDACFTLARMLHHMEQDDMARAYVQQALMADPAFLPAQQLLVEINGAQPDQPAGTAPVQPVAAPPVQSATPQSLQPVAAPRVPQ